MVKMFYIISHNVAHLPICLTFHYLFTYLTTHIGAHAFINESSHAHMMSAIFRVAIANVLTMCILYLAFIG